MEFNRYNLGILLRVCLLVASIFTISFLPLAWSRVFTWMVVLSIILLQIISLIYYCNRQQLRLNSFLEHLGNADATFRPTKEMRGNALFSHMEKAADVFLQARLREQEQYHLLRLLLSKTNSGFILLDRSMVVRHVNLAVQKWLPVQEGEELSQIPFGWEDLAEMAEENKEQEIELTADGRKIRLVVNAATIRQCNAWYVLLTLHDVYALRTANELNAWQRVTRTLNHEIINSITPLSSLAETAQAQLKRAIPQDTVAFEKLEKIIATIHSRSEGLFHFVQEFKKISRTPTIHQRKQPTTRVLDEAVLLLNHKLEKLHVAVIKQFEQDLPDVAVDEHWIGQVFVNLLTNAIDALAEVQQKCLTLNAKQTADSVIIRVHDNGHGIPEELREQLFEPFFSTKASGSGIGLTLSRQIMHMHHGQLFYDESCKQGTAFLLVFPKG